MKCLFLLLALLVLASAQSSRSAADDGKVSTCGEGVQESTSASSMVTR